MVETGITDEIILEQSDNTDITDELGIITTASHTLNQPVEQRKSIGSGLKPIANLDQVAEITGSIEAQPPKLEVLKVFGTFTDNGDGTYTVTFDEKLPTHTLKQQKVDTGGTVTLDNFKFGSFSLDVSEGDTLSLSMDGQGTSFQNDTSETIETPTGDFSARQFFDCVISIGGTVVGSVESATIDHNRELSAFKGIEDDATGEKRLPSELIETDFSFSFNVVINIGNNRAYEEALDDSSSPLEVQDSRTNTTVSIEIDTDDGSDTFELTGALVEEVSAEQNNDGEVRTATLSGVAFDGTVNGDI